MAEEEELNTVVFDNGSSSCKVGIAGNDLPSIIVPTVVGNPKHKQEQLVVQADKEDCYVGAEAQRKRGILSLNYPIQHGIVTDWDAMEKIWHHVLVDELGINPEETPILMTEPPLNPKGCKEKTTQVMFETFHVPSYYLATQTVLSFLASGRHAGISVESGDGVTHIVPVEGIYPVPEAIIRTDLAGRDLTLYLSQLLHEAGYSFSTAAELEIVRDIKERLGYVALDFDEQMRLSETSSILERKYELPDGQKITLGNERFRCAEAMFNRSLLGYEKQLGLSELIHESIMKCDIDLRRHYYCNVILSGGSTLFAGTKERIEKDLKKKVPANIVKVVAPEDRKYSTWVGGSILASLSIFTEMTISKADYEECGPSIIHRYSPF